MVQEDSFWYLDESGSIKAMCIPCHENNNYGWYWNGSETGYGNYDLNCSICGKVIHQID